MLKPGMQLGMYVITGEIGHGGMSTVYRARQQSLQRDVAIKVLPEFFATDPDARERFAREAAIVARLRHRNILTVFDFGEQDGIPYIVTEFLAGETLASRLRDRIPTSESLRVLVAIASALDYAQQHGVLHRDVKPSNVIFDSDGDPILTDFGLSRIAGSLPPLTRTGFPVGTPEYMAPEIASGGTVTASADRYSLAVIAFELLTGQLPYRADAPIAMLLAHINEPVARVSAVWDDAPTGLDELFERALSKDPAERHPTCLDFVAALQSTLAPEAARAGSRPPAGERTEAPPVQFGGDRRLRGPRGSTWVAAALEAIQHPWALLPMAVSGVGAAYLVLLAPAAGGSLAAIGLTVVSAAAAGTATILLTPSIRRGLEDERRAERQREMERRQQQELGALHESLRLGFEACGSASGAEALRKLTDEYHQVTLSLSHETGASLVIALVPGSATETYRRGLSVLVDALEMITAATTPGPHRIRAEMATLQNEIAALELEGGHQQRLTLRQQAIESHRERLHLLEELQIRIDQLLYQAGQCEAALHRARIGIVALRAAGDSAASVESVVSALQRTIEQVRVVQDEVRMLGY